MDAATILAISGSLREGSYNSALIRACIAHAPEGMRIEQADIGSLPLFSEDEEAAFPEEVQRLKERIRAADGILVSTPEYNRSIPGVLKNAIDWTSRPYGDNAWAGKPVCVMGATISGTGTALAQYDLKKAMLYLDALVIGQPEFYMSAAHEKFDDAGNLSDEETGAHIRKMLAAFSSFIERVS